MEGATTRLQHTNMYKRRGRRTADIACHIRGQLLHLGVEQKRAAGDGAKCDGSNLALRLGVACWNSAQDVTDLEFNMNGVNYKMPRVLEMLVMGSLISSEADTM